LKTPIIWMYWAQGISHAPEVVQHCIRSWERKNPDYDIRVLSQEDIADYIDLGESVPHKRLGKMSLAAFSDVVRIHLLARYGGIWVDSTLLCLSALEDWLFTEQPGFPFFGFSRPGADRLISSWFLFADPNSYIATRWAQEVRLFWSKWKWRRHYYWFHHLFNELYSKDLAFKSEWDKAPVHLANGPHHLTPFRENFFEEATEARIHLLKTTDPPVLKLTYKCLKNGYPRGSMIDFVLRNY